MGELKFIERKFQILVLLLKYFLCFCNERYYLRKQQLDPILSQMNPTHALKFSPFITHINITLLKLPSLPNSLKTSFTKILYIFPVYSTCTACIDCLKPSHFRTVIRFGANYKSWSSSLCNFLHRTVTSFLLGPNSILTSRSHTLSICVTSFK